MTPRMTIVAAMARGGAIGRRGDLLFHISDDLRRFKSITMGKPVVMGRKTFESFPNGALPGRRNIVITRQHGYSAPGVETAGSLAEALELASGADEVMIIGGGEIYRQAFPLADSARLTLIDAEVKDADTFMPEFDAGEWTTVEESLPHIDPKSGVAYRFVDLCRRLSE